MPLTAPSVNRHGPARGREPRLGDRERSEKRGETMGRRRERKAMRALNALARVPGRRGLRRRVNPTLRRLETVPLFRDLRRKDLSLLARAADALSYPAGALITDERRPAPQFFVLTAGVVEQTLGGTRIGVAAAGDHFGELTLLDGQPVVPTVRALTDVEAFVLGRREFWGILHESPALSIRLAASLAERLRRAAERSLGPGGGRRTP